jgi:threonylcarbamoyladenosine tRNA methylthiotransferase MtaB
LRELSLRKKRLFHETFLHRRVEVLFEGRRNQQELTGLTGEYVRVNIQASEKLINEIIPVKICEVKEDYCVAEILEDSFRRKNSEVKAA